MSNFDLSDLGGVKKNSQSGSSASFDLSDLGGKVAEKPQQDPTMVDRGLALAKGAISGLGGGNLDTAALIYNFPAMLHNMQSKQTQGMTPEQLQMSGLGEYYGAQEVPIIPSAIDAIEHGIESTTGIQTPEDMRSLYEGTKLAFSLAGIGGLGKAAGKFGMKGLEKAGVALGATRPLELAGATAAGTAMHEVGEEYGPLAGFVAGAGAGALTQKGLQGLNKGLQGLKGTVTGKGPTLGEMTIGRALALKGEPVESVIKTAKENDIQLPFNIPLQSPVANFLANTALNSVFTTRRYNDIIENAPKKLKEKFIKIIDNIHPEDIQAQAASHDYLSVLKPEVEAVEEKASELQKFARGFLKENDKERPTDTVKALKELQEELSVAAPSDPIKFVLNRVEKIIKAWDLGTHSQKISKEFQSDNYAPHVYDQIAKSLHKDPKPVSVKSMVTQLQSLQHDLRSKDAKGVHRLLGKVISGLHEDISRTSNKDFFNHWRAAQSYFKHEVAQRVRTDFAQSMLNETFPKEAFGYMSSPSKINELKRILGAAPEVNKVMNALKRVKLQQVLIDPSISAEGSMNMATFSNKFMKNSKQYDLLKSLLGNKSFHDLKKLAEISQAFSTAGKNFANPSGTAVRLQDQARVMGFLGSLFTGGVGALPVSASIAYPLILSKILSNPRYTDAAVKYALATKKGHMNEALSHQKKMRTLFLDMARKEAPTVINKENKENFIK